MLNYVSQFSNYIDLNDFTSLLLIVDVYSTHNKNNIKRKRKRSTGNISPSMYCFMDCGTYGTLKIK